MLKINKSITLSGTSGIDGQMVVYMTASLNTDGSTNANINKNITNQELYDANKLEIRKDMAKFEEEVYKVEDEFKANLEQVKAGK